MNACALSARNRTIKFNEGDQIDVGFLAIDEDGTIVDITGMTVTADLFIRNKFVHTFRTGSDMSSTVILMSSTSLLISEGAAIKILDYWPSDDEESHGVITLDEAWSYSLPFGALSHLKIVFVDSEGRTRSTERIVLEKVDP